MSKLINRHIVFFRGDQEDDDFDTVMIASSDLRADLDAWCTHNCRGRWKVGWVCGYFDDVRDAVLFKLWWA